MTKNISFLLLFLLIAHYSFAQDDLSEIYDENTEITISGEIKEIFIPKRGPLLLKIKPNKMVYLVVTAPPWFLKQQDVVFDKGNFIEVKGSKFFSREGNIYIIGKELKFYPPGKSIILRDPYSRPLWRGQGMHRR
ncbi:MAG: hypothetical protein N2511_02480 [Thermodesulfovibrionales bacterium]|nr:hypothetical protein [Thermodesulfovibrionales bacterium]